MIKFNYCGTHIEDEKYMNKMSSKGWQVNSLTEGFWNFEKGKANEYTYRIYYFRGMNKDEIENKIKELKKHDIEFVYRYSFWGVFKSKKDFELYKKDEQLKLCNRIRKPMIIAIIICPLLILGFIVLAKMISKLFIYMGILVMIYYLVCLYLMISYTKLIKKLK